MSQTKIRGSKQFFADADIDFNSKKITGLATPTLDTDAATKAYVDQILAAGDALLYKGVIDCSTNPNYPAADAGHTYKVSVAGKIGGASGPDVVAGDLIICTTDGTSAGNHATVGANWDIVHVAGAAGTVISTAVTPLDNQIVRLDGAGGVTIQNSLATIDDSGSVNVPTGQAYKINGSALTQDNIPDGTTNKAYTATEQTKLAGIEAAADVTDAVNVGSSIQGASAKATIVDADKIAMIDTEAANVLKTVTVTVLKTNLKTYNDTLYAPVLGADDNYVTDAEKTVIGNTSGTNTGDETATTLGTKINGATEKTTPVDADMVGLMDSAASNILKKLSWANIKATLKTYFMGNLITREAPSGVKNGSNVTFTLANTPVSGTEMVFLNGILQNAGATEDYTISGLTITMIVAPISTDVILVTYWK